MFDCTRTHHVSIAAALALALAGTTVGSIAQTEIQSVLNIQSHSDLPLLSDIIVPTSKSKRSSLGIDLSIANGIWTADGVRPEYIQTAKKVHKAVAGALPTTYDPINDFVSNQTKGMIKDILQGDIDPLTRAVLVNAIYFKGKYHYCQYLLRGAATL